MKLNEMIADLPVLTIVGDATKNVDYLSCKADKIKNNTMFFCIVGTKVDGHIFAQKVALEGASVIVTERVLAISDMVTQVVVQDSRIFMSLCAKVFYKNACDNLKIIGITGTNGKTSTTYILKSILEDSGFTVGVIGTNGVWVDKKHYTTQLTTPDPIELHEWFYKMFLNGVEYVLMEVSAHAIWLGKIEGIYFEIGVLTNFSRDHLDFFKNIDEYAEAKSKFFTKKYCKVAVVNGDDALGQKIAKQNKLPTITFGLDSPTDIFAIDEKITAKGISYTINLFDEIATVEYGLKGKFNVFNTLCASSVARILGINLEKIAQGISKVECIEGRTEIYNLKNGCRVVVDFAHTPEGFANILAYLKSTTTGKLYCVFGCGGDRDKTKREKIGAIVSKYANKIIITSDNPRNEEPLSIIREILNGVDRRKTHIIIPSRKEAIVYGVKTMKSNDVLVLLGKGHEEYEINRDGKFFFSEKRIIDKALNNGF